MALILLLETATTNCSVALASDGVILASRSINSGYSHSEKINLFIEAVILEATVKLNQLDAIAVSAGPGSYTGLRIGVSTAKGLCYALDKPLISVNTLDAMAQGIHCAPDELIVPMIDARRMEAYCAVYSDAKQRLSPPEAIIIETDFYSKFRTNKKLLLVGDGADKCMELFRSANDIRIQDGFMPNAEFLSKLAEEKYALAEFENVALFEPIYLKEFVAGPTKK